MTFKPIITKFAVEAGSVARLADIVGVTKMTLFNWGKVNAKPDVYLLAGVLKGSRFMSLRWRFAARMLVAIWRSV